MRGCGSADRLYGQDCGQGGLQGSKLGVILQPPCLHLSVGALQSAHDLSAGGEQAWQFLHALLQVQVRAPDPIAQQQVAALPAVRLHQG